MYPSELTSTTPWQYVVIWGAVYAALVALAVIAILGVANWTACHVFARAFRVAFPVTRSAFIDVADYVTQKLPLRLQYAAGTVAVFDWVERNKSGRFASASLAYDRSGFTASVRIPCHAPDPILPPAALAGGQECEFHNVRYTWQVVESGGKWSLLSRAAVTDNPPFTRLEAAKTLAALLEASVAVASGVRASPLPPPKE